MKSNDIAKQLFPGVIVGLILGFTLTMIVGVNKENPIPNYIGGAMCCFIPTLLNCVIVLKGTAKCLDRKLSIGKAFSQTLPYAFIALLIGLFVVAIFLERIIGISTRDISKLVTAIYQAILGVVASTIAAFIALKRYEKNVKYTRR